MLKHDSRGLRLDPLAEQSLQAGGGDPQRSGGEQLSKPLRRVLAKLVVSLLVVFAVVIAAAYLVDGAFFGADDMPDDAADPTRKYPPSTALAHTCDEAVAA